MKLVTSFIEGCSRSDPALQPTFSEDSLHLMQSYGFIALSLSPPSHLVVQVSTRPAEDAYHPFQCLTQLAQSPLASQLSPLYCYMAWNDVTPI